MQHLALLAAILLESSVGQRDPGARYIARSGGSLVAVTQEGLAVGR